MIDAEYQALVAKAKAGTLTDEEYAALDAESRARTSSVLAEQYGEEE